MQEYFSFPAAVGIQGGRRFYSAMVPFGVLKRFLAFDTGNVLDRSQRDVDAARATKVANYIQDNPGTWVIPSLVGNVNVEPEFEEHKAGAMVGTLKLPMDAEIKLFDGQHRSAGIMAAIQNDPNLRSSCVPVQLYVDLSLVQRQQAFTDINLNAKAVSRSLSMVYNHRDKSTKALADAVKMVPAWMARIEWQKTNCTGDNPNLFPFKAISEAARIYLGIGNKESMSAEQISSVAEFFTAVSPAAHWPATFFSGELNMRDERETWITYHVVGLKAIALWGYQLRNAGIDIQDGVERLQAIRKQFDRSNENVWGGKCMDYEGRMRCTKDAITDTARYLCLATNVDVPEHCWK